MWPVEQVWFTRAPKFILSTMRFIHCHSRCNVPVSLFLLNSKSVCVKLLRIAFPSFSFPIHFLLHLLFLSFFSFYFLGHSFFCMQLLTFTTRDIFHLQSFFFFFSYSFLHCLLFSSLLFYIHIYFLIFMFIILSF